MVRPCKLQSGSLVWNCPRSRSRSCLCSDVPPSATVDALGSPAIDRPLKAVPAVLPDVLRLDGETIVAPCLSGRQREVMALVVRGKTDWEIGCILGISAKTVNFHVETAKRKLSAATRSQAVASLVWASNSDADGRRKALSLADDESAMSLILQLKETFHG